MLMGSAAATRPSAGRDVKLRPPHFIGIGLLALALVAAVVVQLTGLGKGPMRFGLTTVTGVVGSEKLEFFQDPAVQDVFAKHGYEVNVTKSGSWRMAELDDIESNDFAFPASEMAAQRIEQTHKSAVASTHKPFFSPMAIATFEPILTILEQADVASKSPDGRWQFDMAKYLELVKADTRWNQLPGADKSYPSPRTVMLTSTDVRTSNSAGMYLSLASYVLNGNSVVSSASQADTYLPELERLFLGQGYSGTSSTAPFDDYLSQGSGAVPMVMIYEGQFLEEQFKPNSRIQPGMTLAYPSPTAFSVHTGVSFSEHGTAIMQLLETDPELASLLAAHGFRPQGQNAGVFQSFLAEHALESQYPATSSFVNVAQEPSYETLDYMLIKIGDAYTQGGAPPPVSEEPTNTSGGTP